MTRSSQRVSTKDIKRGRRKAKIMKLTAGQIADIEARALSNCQPVTVTVAGTSYTVPYRIAQEIRSGRRTRDYISRGSGMKAVARSRAQLAAELQVDILVAREIAHKVR